MSINKNNTEKKNTESHARELVTAVTLSKKGKAR